MCAVDEDTRVSSSIPLAKLLLTCSPTRFEPSAGALSVWSCSQSNYVTMGAHFRPSDIGKLLDGIIAGN